jgi:alpha-glucosidase
LNELAAITKTYPGRLLIAETVPEESRNIDSYLAFYEYVDPSVLAPFNFAAIALPWQAADFKGYFDKFQAKLKPDFTPAYTFGNHDSPRLASRIGETQARAAALLLLALPGMPFIYYGEELGLKDIKLRNKKQQDQARRYPHLHMGRDGERSPMPWNSGPHASFTRTIPWLPVNRNYKKVNVNAETRDVHSMLNLYRRLLALRTRSEILTSGSYVAIRQNNKNLYMFVRELAGRRLLVVINYSAKPQLFQQTGETVISSAKTKPRPGKLKAYEARITTL